MPVEDEAAKDMEEVEVEVAKVEKPKKNVSKKVVKSKKKWTLKGFSCLYVIYL